MGNVSMMKVFREIVTFVLALLLVNVAASLLVPLVHATYVEYPDLEYHLWDNMVSSLQVQGTVILYEHQNFQGASHQFTDTSVNNLLDYNFDNAASSLKVNGKVTLWEHPDCAGWRAITFTSEPFTPSTWGTTWNYNPSLVKGSGKWDSRVLWWHWPSGDNQIEGPDDEKYVDWVTDGLVESKATDNPVYSWLVATNFDQGYENNIVSDRCPDLPFGGGSLKVHGTVTLYDQPNYQGNSKSFTNARVAWLDDWYNRARSLIVDGTVNLWQQWGYQDSRLFFTKVSAQPTPLRVGATSEIRLEGVVTDWWWNWFGQDSAAGIKFDVVLTEDHSGPDALRLMMELYIVRQGLLNWQFSIYRQNTILSGPPLSQVCNYRAALECWSEYVKRTIYSGEIMQWSMNLKALIQEACNAFPALLTLGMDNLYIAKISYTVEADAFVSSPSISCNLHRLRLSYRLAGGGGGGMWCPTLYSWDGSAYAEEGLLGIHGDSDVTINQTLEHLSPINRLCPLSLRELDNHTSHVDQVRLFAVDADDNWYECSLRFAWHSRLGRVEALLLRDDESRVNLTPTERAELLFLIPENVDDVHHFVFQLNGHNPKGLY